MLYEDIARQALRSSLERDSADAIHLEELRTAGAAALEVMREHARSQGVTNFHALLPVDVSMHVVPANNVLCNVLLRLKADGAIELMNNDARVYLYAVNPREFTEKAVGAIVAKLRSR